MTARPRARRAEAGFTMIELLVTTSVTVIALAGLLAIHTSSIRANRSAEHTAQAVAIGQRTLEELRSMPVDAIVERFGAGVWPIETDLAEVSAAGAAFRRSLTVSELGEDADLVLVRVDVEWTEAGAAPGSADGRYDHAIALEVVRTKVDLL